MFVLIIAKYRLLQELFQYGTVYNSIIVAGFFVFFFAVLKINVTSKKLEQTTRTNKLLKKHL